LFLKSIDIFIISNDIVANDISKANVFKNIPQTLEEVKLNGNSVRGDKEQYLHLFSLKHLNI